MGNVFNPQLECMYGSGGGPIVFSADSGVFAGSFLVAQLPVTGIFARAINGRGLGEGPGAGTGAPVYFAAGAWRTYYNCAPVQA